MNLRDYTYHSLQYWGRGWAVVPSGGAPIPPGPDAHARLAEQWRHRTADWRGLGVLVPEGHAVIYVPESAEPLACPDTLILADKPRKQDARGCWVLVTLDPHDTITVPDTCQLLPAGSRLDVPPTPNLEWVETSARRWTEQLLCHAREVPWVTYESAGAPARPSTADVVRAYLACHPIATAEQVVSAVKRRRADVLSALKEIQK